MLPNLKRVDIWEAISFDETEHSEEHLKEYSAEHLESYLKSLNIPDNETSEMRYIPELFRCLGELIKLSYAGNVGVANTADNITADNITEERCVKMTDLKALIREKAPQMELFEVRTDGELKFYFNKNKQHTMSEHDTSLSEHATSLSER
jgi:hypothetical protein